MGNNISSKQNDNPNLGYSGILKVDILLILITIVLTVIGIMFIYSSEYLPEEYSSNIKMETGEKEVIPLYLKQILFCVPSIILAFIIFLIRTDKIQKVVWFVYGGVLILLILVLIIGISKYGSKSWFGIGGFGIQPSEFAKLSVILALAWYINFIGEKIKDWKFFLLGIAIPMPVIGLILLQPDFGTILVFVPTIIIMLFMGGCKVLHIITVTITGVLAFIGGIIIKAPFIVSDDFNFLLSIFANNKNLIIIIVSSALIVGISFLLLRKYKNNIVLRIFLCLFLSISLGLSASYGAGMVLKEHHIKRFISFSNPEYDLQNTGYSLKQSIVAIGAGGPEGQGWLQGRQNHLGFITVKWADYIFSVYAEEMGFRGTILLLILYGLLIFRGIVTIFYAKNMFGGLVASGIVGIIVFQVFINLSVTIGVFPVVGITLPFLSAGGSSIITFIVAMGLLVNIQYEGKVNKKSILL